MATTGGNIFFDRPLIYRNANVSIGDYNTMVVASSIGAVGIGAGVSITGTGSIGPVGIGVGVAAGDSFVTVVGAGSTAGPGTLGSSIFGSRCSVSAPYAIALGSGVINAVANTMIIGDNSNLGPGTGAIHTLTIEGYNGGALHTMVVTDNPPGSSNNPPGGTTGLTLVYNNGSVANKVVKAAAAPPAGALILYLEDLPSGFVTRWTVAGDGTARTITLPLSDGNGSAFACTIDWGDGTPKSTVTAYDSPHRTHTYAVDGTYDVTIVGQCEGWSFNNGGDCLKLVSIVNWGSSGLFSGFKYLAGGFFGCENNTSLGVGKILPAGTALTDLSHCFDHNHADTIPTGLLDYCENVTDLSYCFFYGYFTGIPARLLDYCTAATNLSGCFASNFISVIPNGLLDRCPALTNLYYCFGSNYLTAIPDSLFDHNPLITNLASCFQNNYIAALPAHLLDLCLVLTNMQGFVSSNRIASIPTNWLINNTLLTNLSYCFCNNPPLQISDDTFYAPGGEATRFLGLTMDFSSCYLGSDTTGPQGTAPDLWNCDYGETITLDTAPAVDWIAGDVITGQTSGAVATVVSQVSPLVYKIKQHYGDFTSGEVVGVTGVPSKLAAQTGICPVFAGTPNSNGCFFGIPDASLSNAADIPAYWGR